MKHFEISALVCDNNMIKKQFNPLHFQHFSICIVHNLDGDRSYADSKHMFTFIGAILSIVHSTANNEKLHGRSLEGRWMFDREVKLHSKMLTGFAC